MIIPMGSYFLKTSCENGIVELRLSDGVEIVAVTAVNKDDWYECANETANSSKRVEPNGNNDS